MRRKLFLNLYDEWQRAVIGGIESSYLQKEKLFKDFSESMKIGTDLNIRNDYHYPTDTYAFIDFLKLEYNIFDVEEDDEKVLKQIEYILSEKDVYIFIRVQNKDSYREIGYDIHTTSKKVGVFYKEAKNTLYRVNKILAEME